MSTHRATVAGIRNLLENGGFSVVRVVERTGRMRFANGTALLNHHFIKLGFLDAWKKVVPGRETEMFLRLRTRLDEVAAQNGELRAHDPDGLRRSRRRLSDPYFHPLGFRVNRAGKAAFFSGMGSDSPDAILISRSRSSSLGRPAS